MRSSTRPSFFALVIGLWIISSAIVFVSVLVAPPARGDEVYGPARWSPTGAQPLESDGEVVLTFTKTEPGRITYRTIDGDCSIHPPMVSDPGYDCGRPRAQAPEDYGHVSGEWIFTEAGSRTITIPIVDDDLDEVNEPFMVWAAEGSDAREQAWLYSAESVRIIDDDPSDDPEDPPARTAPTATTAGGRSSRSSGANAIPGSDDGDAEVQPGSGSELASGELEPGPGFEPVIERDPEPASGRNGRSGDSASWFAFGLGTIALGSGGVVWVRRRRRLSPTRS